MAKAQDAALEAAIRRCDPNRHILIAGPTASGKSALALALAEQQGGTIVNADAIQVYADWRVLTARPSVEEEARAPHRLYGHVPGTQAYSVGHWLREVGQLLHIDRLIIVGGTGLYFTALTEGLAEIPPISAEIRAEADQRLASGEHAQMVAELDPKTAQKIDRQNPMRVQRAWEVQMATGKGLAQWQDETPPPLMSQSDYQAFVLDSPKEWLTPRIEARFQAMVEGGALDEAHANHATWHRDLPSAKAIGAAELMAYLDGEISIDQVVARSSILTRQFAKRQRTWFRARMKTWERLSFAS